MGATICPSCNNVVNFNVHCHFEITYEVNNGSYLVNPEYYRESGWCHIDAENGYNVPPP